MKKENLKRKYKFKRKLKRKSNSLHLKITPILTHLNRFFKKNRSLQIYYGYYGDSFKVELPTGSGHFATLEEVAEELSSRLIKLFAKDTEGRIEGSEGKCKNQEKVDIAVLAKLWMK